MIEPAKKKTTTSWLNPRDWKVRWENRRISRALSKTLGMKCDDWIVIATDGKKMAWRTAGSAEINVWMLDHVKKVLETSKQRN